MDGNTALGSTGGSVHGPTFWLLAGGQRAFSVQVKEVDIRTSLPFSDNSMRMPVGFKENCVDQCNYLKVSRSNFIFLALYVDDILLASRAVARYEGIPHMSLELRFTNPFPEAISEGRNREVWYIAQQTLYCTCTEEKGDRLTVLRSARGSERTNDQMFIFISRDLSRRSIEERLLRGRSEVMF